MAKLSGDVVAERLGRLPGWAREGDQITRTYDCGSFMGAIGLVNRVAEQAEAMDHHPDILIHGYSKVTFRLTTHDSGGITARDFTLAGRIEAASQAG